MSYPIETKLASRTGWYTPDEARAHYGRYSRDFYICHWWGQPGSVGTHDETVAYILNTARAGTMSVNYVVSDTKITLLVDPVNVSWGSQNGNPIGINVEHDPRLSEEGYKRAGWLKYQLEQRFGKQLGMRKHSDFNPTACPGTIDLARIERECEKLRQGVSDMLTREEIIVEYRLVTLGEPAPESHIVYWTGKPLSDYLQYLESDPSIQALQASYKTAKAPSAPLATPLAPGLYQVN